MELQGWILFYFKAEIADLGYCVNPLCLLGADGYSNWTDTQRSLCVDIQEGRPPLEALWS